MEIAFEAYRAQLAGLGVKKAKLPPRLHIPRPKPTSAASKPTKPARRPATVDEVKQMLSAAFTTKR